MSILTDEEIVDLRYMYRERDRGPLFWGARSRGETDPYMEGLESNGYVRWVSSGGHPGYILTAKGVAVGEDTAQAHAAMARLFPAKPAPPPAKRCPTCRRPLPA